MAGFGQVFGGIEVEAITNGVEILPISARNANTGEFSLGEETDWGAFEKLEIGIGINSSAGLSYGTIIASRKLMMNNITSWKAVGSFSSLSNTFRLDINATSHRTAAWVGSTELVNGSVWPLYVVGHKRELSTLPMAEVVEDLVT